MHIGSVCLFIDLYLEELLEYRYAHLITVESRQARLMDHYDVVQERDLSIHIRDSLDRSDHSFCDDHDRHQSDQ